MSKNSKSSVTLSELAALPQFAPVVKIAPGVLSMTIMEIDPALIEAVELKEARLDEIKAKKDDAKRLIVLCHEIAKTLGIIFLGLDFVKAGFPQLSGLYQRRVNLHNSHGQDLWLNLNDNGSKLRQSR